MSYRPWNQEQRQRPTGILLLVILTVIVGVIDLVSGLLSFPFGILTLAIGVLLLVTAWGLWGLKSWAYWTMVALLALNVAATLCSLAFSGFNNLGWNIIALLIMGGSLAYLLLDQRVRALFRV